MVGLVISDVASPLTQTGRNPNVVPVYSAGYISSGNSTITALGAGSTFTGTGETTGHPDMMVTLKTDVEGTLYVDLSIDGGSDYDTTIPFAITAVLSGSNGSFCLPYSPKGWFETAAGVLLNLEVSTSSVFGVIGYTEV